MRYSNGIEVMLGDKVTVSIPAGNEPARVVMLGETCEHLDVEESFLAWVSKGNILVSSYIVVEWLNRNPFEHNDPKHAPVGRYMFTGLDYGVIFLERGA